MKKEMLSSSPLVIGSIKSLTRTAIKGSRFGEESSSIKNMLSSRYLMASKYKCPVIIMITNIYRIFMC